MPAVITSREELVLWEQCVGPLDENTGLLSGWKWVIVRVELYLNHGNRGQETPQSDPEK